ncbi:MAG: protein kinase [Deltaproteobacteria bacterium]|nr:protein kinase [Deltaproteobacteria bacterium]
MGDFPIGFGRYSLIERLAVGGMAELFVATSPGEHGFQKKVVIKRLLPQLIGDETYTAMFIDEAKLTARLVHPKIAQTFELGKVDGALYIAMEYVDGIDVLALLREFAARRRRVDPQLAAWIAHEVLDALDYAHNLKDDTGQPLGIVHRDISPSNVLCSVRGDVKLVDFGIARAKDPDRAHKSKSGTLKGKYGYMSPEQVIELPLDGRSDVFSVGVVLAELLTGRRLFAAPNELDVLLMVRDAKLGRFDKYGFDIEPGLQTIVRKALKKPLEERWASAAAFRDALAEWLFEHRHRITNKHVAEVVNELRESVNARRNRPASEAPALPGLDEIAHGRAPSDSMGIPQIQIEGGDEISAPVISINYEDAQPDPPARPISSDGMAASGSTKRAETVQARPGRTPTPQQPVVARTQTPQKPVIARVPTPQKPAVARTKTPQKPARTPSGTPSDAVVEIPIADTISAAVEAIVQPEQDKKPKSFQREEDSVTRNFDDLTVDPGIERSFPPMTPSADELARKKPPTPPALSDIAEPPDDAGDFSVTSPMRVLFRLMTARATGLLVVAVGGIKKEIYVRDGQPEYVSSNVASELFGNYLVTKGVLSDGELAMALAMMPHYGGKLGDTLVGLGLLKPLEVFRHLTRQVRTKIIDVCTWNKGGFAWYAGRENPREAFPLDFNAFEILGAGAMALSDDVTDAWLAKHGSSKLRASRTRRVGPERFEVKGLVELFETLDGTRTVTKIIDSREEREEQLKVARMLCLLEACDLARPS